MRLTKYDKAAFVRAVMQDVPRIDYHARTTTVVDNYFAAKAPKDVVVFGKKHPGLLKGGRICPPTPLGYVHTQFALDGDDYNIASTHPALWAELQPLAEADIAQRERLRELEARVRGIIEACTTLKRAKDLLPEFEKYLPKDRGAAGTADLPVANVVADLAKAGWPKKEN